MTPESTVPTDQNCDITPTTKGIDREGAVRELLKNHEKYKTNPELLERDIQNNLNNTIEEPVVELPWHHPDYSSENVPNMDYAECIKILTRFKRVPTDPDNTPLSDLRGIILASFTDPEIKSMYLAEEFEREQQRIQHNRERINTVNQNIDNLLIFTLRNAIEKNWKTVTTQKKQLLEINSTPQYRFTPTLFSTINTHQNE
jgi:hypothetical protein